MRSENSLRELPVAARENRLDTADLGVVIVEFYLRIVYLRAEMLLLHVKLLERILRLPLEGREGLRDKA